MGAALRHIPILALALLCLLQGGCNIVAPAFLIAHGPEKVPQTHQLEPARPTVVLVDVSGAAAVRPAVRAALAEQVGRDLMQRAGVKTVVDPRSAQSIASLDRFTSQMPVSEIGRSVGAEVVIHVIIDSFSLTPDNQTYAPRAALRVKVIDAANEQRRFPDNREGHELAVSPRTSARTLPERGVPWNDAEREFAVYAGEAVAQLFYEHERGTSRLLGR